MRVAKVQDDEVQVARGQVAVEWMAGAQVAKVKVAGVQAAAVVVAERWVSQLTTPLLKGCYLQVVEEELQVLGVSCLLSHFHWMQASFLESDPF